MTPALVLGGPVVSTLGVIRSLGRKQIPQFCIGAGTSFVSVSRWHRLPRGATRDAPTPSSLAAFLAEHAPHPAVLVPCSDPWVAAVASLGSALTTRFPASVASAESLDVLLDKGRLAETMGRLGLPHPRTILIGPRDELPPLPNETSRGWFLKPRDSNAFQRRYGVKGFWFNTAAEVRAFVIGAREAALDLCLQEYIPGPPSLHHFVDGFVDRNGRICARFARQRLRMFPTDFGNSSCNVSVSLETVRGAVETLDRLLETISYRGVFSAEFKYDERDQLFKLLEVNPRPGFQIDFAAKCGVDVCEMAYQDALGLPVKPIGCYAIGRRWVYFYYDRQICWQLLRERRLSPRAWLRSWVGAMPAIFARDDPAPALFDFGERLRNAISHRFGRRLQ